MLLILMLLITSTSFVSSFYCFGFSAPSCYGIKKCLISCCYCCFFVNSRCWDIFKTLPPHRRQSVACLIYLWSNWLCVSLQLSCGHLNLLWQSLLRCPISKHDVHISPHMLSHNYPNMPLVHATSMGHGSAEALNITAFTALIQQLFCNNVTKTLCLKGLYSGEFTRRVTTYMVPK